MTLHGVGMDIFWNMIQIYANSLLQRFGLGRINFSLKMAGPHVTYNVAPQNHISDCHHSSPECV